MSGGVDSSLTAALLARRGLPVIGITLRLQAAAGASACAADRAVEDARAAAGLLGIPHHVLDATDLFEREVALPFVQAYGRGLTPNPCVACNARVKFGALLASARDLGATRLATGHYANTARDRATGRTVLRRARDLRKDQSYFLYRLDQVQLSAALFPLGETDKTETRRLAAALGLAAADRPESQQACFVAGDYRAYLFRRDPALFRPGDIRDVDGGLLGRHGGLAGYTVGQRHGLGLGSPRAYYVVRIDPARNTLIVGAAAALDVPAIEVAEWNLIAQERLRDGQPVLVKYRSSGPAVPATVRDPDAERARLVFRAPQRALAPGQAAVLYDPDDPDLVIGGGTIRLPA
jgi:tRNA-specific 2-thiouridylase